MFNHFKDLISQYTSIDETTWRFIEPKLYRTCYKKGETLLYSGDVCQKIIFINSGISRMYYFNEYGKEFTCHISYSEAGENIIDRFAVDYNSFMTQNPSVYTIEALQDMDVIEIFFDDSAGLSSQIDIFHQIDTKINQLIHAEKSDILIEMNTTSTSERYKAFKQRFKPIYTKIPQYIIASYLGITPVALSRLKNKQS